MNDKFRQKEALIDKLQLKNVSLKGQIQKADQQIKQKDEMGDDLKFIDFHQLQIENKKHVNDIEERNKKLIKLKHTKGKTDNSLQGLKDKLKAAEEKQQKLIQDIKSDQVQIVEAHDKISKINKDIKKIDYDHQQLEAFKKRNEDMPAVQDYVSQKKQEEILKKQVKNYQRKIEIAEVEAKEASKKIRQSQMKKRTAY